MDLVKAKKYLGQHFLKDKNIARRISESLSDRVGKVLEIGPGMGVLTKYVLQRNYPNFWVIEIDEESVRYLENHYPELKNHIYFGDFLKLDLSQLFLAEKFSVIGNFPYNISSQILFKVFENRKQIPEVVECHFVTGNHSLLLKLYCTNHNHLMEILIDTIQNIPGVHKTETMISLDQAIERQVWVKNLAGKKETAKKK
jgi:DNA-binding Lrp family transcriptional regulator